jgi:hypothetical protein
MQNVYEQFFFLKYAGGWSFAEAYNLPVGLRTWFTNRLAKQLEDENTAIQDASRGSGATELTADNSPQMPAHMQEQFSKAE